VSQRFGFEPESLLFQTPGRGEPKSVRLVRRRGVRKMCLPNLASWGLSAQKLVTNSSPKIGRFRGVFRVSENGKARQLKGCRAFTSDLTR
jgi:hypothetical protein